MGERSAGAYEDFVGGEKDGLKQPVPERPGNLYETAEDRARTDRLRELLRRATEKNPGSTLTRRLSEQLGDIDLANAKLIREQEERKYGAELERKAMDNLRLRVDLLTEEMADPTPQIELATKMLERARLNVHLVGRENRPAEYERQIAEFEALKKDLSELGEE